MPALLKERERKMEKLAEIVRDAGGELVGRTRLQKIVYLLTAAGLEDDFRFSYKRYGPYSEELADVAERAVLFGKVSEKEGRADWGSVYSIYSVEASSMAPRDGKEPDNRQRIVSEAAEVNAIVLELAATAVFLSKEGFDDPWAEVAHRKAVKHTHARRRSAKTLLKKLRDIKVPEPLPDNVV